MSTKYCKLEGCGKAIDKAAGFGYCQMHYRRLKTHGDVGGPLPTVAKAGSGTINVYGYREISQNGRRVLEHVAVVEKALGKPLPKGAVIHHINEDKTDNRPENLLVCPDRKYHNLIHLRMEALAATGSPDSRKCVHCQQWDKPENLYKTTGYALSMYHKKCKSEYNAAYQASRRGV